MNRAAYLIAVHMLAIAAPPIVGLPFWATLLFVGFIWLGFFGASLTERKG